MLTGFCWIIARNIPRKTAATRTWAEKKTEKSKTTSKFFFWEKLCKVNGTRDKCIHIFSLWNHRHNGKCMPSEICVERMEKSWLAVRSVFGNPKMWTRFSYFAFGTFGTCVLHRKLEQNTFWNIIKYISCKCSAYNRIHCMFDPYSHSAVLHSSSLLLDLSSFLLFSSVFSVIWFVFMGIGRDENILKFKYMQFA